MALFSGMTACAWTSLLPMTLCRVNIEPMTLPCDAGLHIDPSNVRPTLNKAYFHLFKPVRMRHVSSPNVTTWFPCFREKWDVNTGITYKNLSCMWHVRHDCQFFGLEWMPSQQIDSLDLCSFNLVCTQFQNLWASFALFSFYSGGGLGSRKLAAVPC